MKPLKSYTRDEFNRCAIGRQIVQSGLLDAIEKDGGFFDGWKPYYIHEVMAAAPALEGSYYALHGYRNTTGTVHFTLTLGNGMFDAKHGELMPFGTEFDRIDVHFAIDPGDPGTIELRHINRFRCPEGEPKNELQAEFALDDVEAYMELLHRGHIVNFQRDKIALWQASGKNPGALSEIWARSLTGDQPLAKSGIRRLVATGKDWPGRAYIPAP
jgi:hypothetical protein